MLDFVGGGGLEAIRVGIFAAFTGIAAATKLVHGQGQRAVGLRAERAERHGLGAEALDDGLERLDLLQRDGRIGNGVEQVPKKDGTLMFRQFFKRGVGLRIRSTHMGVHAANDFRRTGVEFRAFAKAVKPGIREIIGFGRERRVVQAQIVREEIVERFLTGIIGGVFKHLRTEMLGKTDDFKEMAVAITGQGGDAHAREDFAQTGIDSCVGPFRAARFERLRKLISKVRHDGARADRNQERHMMGVKDLRRLDNERHIPQAFANHGLPHCGCGEERRQGRANGINRAIGKEEESRAPAAAQRGSRKLSKTAARPRNSSGGRKSNIDALLGAKNRAELRQLARRNHGTRQSDSVFQVNIERHHVGFTQGVNGRVSDLGETLLAVIPQGSWKGRKKCGRCVVAHAPVRFFAACQGGKQNLKLVFGPAGGASDALWLIDADEGRDCRGGQHSLRNSVARLLDGEALEDIAPAQEEARGRIGKNHFSWTEALALSDLRFFEIDEAGFGAGDEETIMRQGVAQRAEPIAVELRANELTIGKDECGGTIPGFGVLGKRG